MELINSTKYRLDINFLDISISAPKPIVEIQDYASIFEISLKCRMEHKSNMLMVRTCKMPEANFVQHGI